MSYYEIMAFRQLRLIHFLKYEKADFSEFRIPHSIRYNIE